MSEPTEEVLRSKVVALMEAARTFEEEVEKLKAEAEVEKLRAGVAP